ncbi:FIG003879: Predicted amidohydrolase / Aliphatic amidase AmiE [hydrothermal vent metagenome]|uniref:FIG003879: Predicted amidohydrolase / Aliphatic amidase AmiE n=1 Tax=hydrothermal vent metagenome TaxID=652676 RepID=A0A3B1DN32_9ZZZZ
MKVAVIQFNATSNKQDNITKAVDFVRQAAHQKAEFILLPEVFVFRGKRESEVLESIPGESLKPVMDLAQRHKIFILAGSIYERCPKEKNKAYNTSVLIDSRGKIQAKYRKIHLFDAVIDNKKICESAQFLAGRRRVLTHVKGFGVGLSICYDLRFSQMYKKYTELGAEILCVPSAFTRQTGRVHWEILLRARAIENTCYVLAPNQVGQDGRGVYSYGHSMIIDPWGEILAEASAEQEEIIFAKLDKKLVKKMRLMIGR